MATATVSTLDAIRNALHAPAPLAPFVAQLMAETTVAEALGEIRSLAEACRAAGVRAGFSPEGFDRFRRVAEARAIEEQLAAGQLKSSLDLDAVKGFVAEGARQLFEAIFGRGAQPAALTDLAAGLEAAVRFHQAEAERLSPPPRAGWYQDAGDMWRQREEKLPDPTPEERSRAQHHRRTSIALKAFGEAFQRALGAEIRRAVAPMNSQEGIVLDLAGARLQAEGVALPPRADGSIAGEHRYIRIRTAIQKTTHRVDAERLVNAAGAGDPAAARELIETVRRAPGLFPPFADRKLTEAPLLAAEAAVHPAGNAPEHLPN